MFDRVFVSDPSFNSTFAQNKSCSSYRSLQLLFWPNFKFLYQISRFGWSKSAKNHSISVNWDSPVCAQCTAGPRRWRRHASAVAANLVPREPSYPLPVPVPIRTIPFSNLPRVHAELSSSSVSSPASSGRPTPLFFAPLLDSPHPNPLRLTPHLQRLFPEPTDPLRGRIGLPTAGRHHRARRTSPSPSNSPLRPPSAQIESPVSFSALSSPFPTPSPLESRTAGAGAPPRKPCCAAGARRAPPLRGPARRRRAPRGRRAPLVVAPPPPAGALLRHGRNGPATARRREPPSPLALAPPRAACALAPAPPRGRPRSAGPP